MKTLGEQLRDGPSEEVCVVGAGEGVEVTKRKATPGGAEYAEPGYSVEWIEGGSCEGQRIEDLGAGGELFQIDGAGGDWRFSQGPGGWLHTASGRAESFSRSTARKGIAALRRARAIGASALRVRPRMAIRYLSPLVRAAFMRSMWLRIKATISSIWAVRGTSFSAATFAVFDFARGS